MLIRIPLLAFLLLTLASVSTPQATAIKAGRLLDPKSGNLLPNQTIVIEGGRIISIGSHITIPSDVTVIDLSNLTVLPGLIDCHTHVLLQPEDERGIPPNVGKTQAFRTVQGVAAAKKNLEAGFTTLRDVDSEGAEFADVAIRDGINKGIIPGPRMLVSTLALSITGGHMNVYLNPALHIPNLAAMADSKEAMVAEVRRQIKYGADWIKLYATGTLRHINPQTLEPMSQVSIEEVQAVVNEAKRFGKDVAAHAYGGEGAKNAILGGARSIEHGMLMDDEILRLMVQKGTYWCPTLGVYIPEHPEDDTEFRRRIVARHREVFQKAMKMGVKIAFGTDVGAYAHGTSVREFILMVDYGMKPLDAIRSATLTASELLRMEREIGTLEPGKYADIIAVEGNPLENIRALERVKFVMKEGKTYKME
ncbi:MAG TPA: amidohydrolase family protein [Bacteroidota bacterium]|nr:amidohydrolase family protein [Bacteroidota bacterium]